MSSPVRSTLVGFRQTGSRQTGSRLTESRETGGSERGRKHRHMHRHRHGHNTDREIAKQPEDPTVRCRIPGVEPKNILLSKLPYLPPGVSVAIEVLYS